MRALRDIFVVCLLWAVASAGLLRLYNFDIASGKNGILDRIIASNPKPQEGVDTLTGKIAPQAEEVSSKITPAVVTIYGLHNETVDMTPPYNSNEDGNNIFSFFQRQRRLATVQVSAGSGFFIDPHGYILTNKHVVASENTEYIVMLAGGERLPATVTYRDPKEDLAVVKISGNNYPALELGDSSKLKIGQTVMGAGNAFGRFPNTVSQGSVAGLHKNVAVNGTESGQLANLIQTSIPLFPGNSGGPTFDLEGKVVGVNVAAAADGRNISFSIPIDYAKGVISTFAQK